MDALAALAEALASGSVEVVDLTQPLHEATPTIQLPPPFANTPGWKLHQISAYDGRGPAWMWHWFEGGEHVGTHFDAPTHWITGRDGEDVSQVPPRRLIGPAAVIDRTAEVAANPDFLLDVEHLQAWQAQHGPLPDGGWLLYRTGWGVRAESQQAFLNADEQGPHTPGLTVAAARWLATETGIVGLGVETVGTDAGAAHAFDPPFPCHYHLMGAGKYGLTQLANLDRLPPTGSLIVVAPLKIVKGTGSPTRVFALVPRG